MSNRFEALGLALALASFGAAAGMAQDGEHRFLRGEGPEGLRVTFPEADIVRIQHFRDADALSPDGRYLAVVDYDLDAPVEISETDDAWIATTDALDVRVDRASLNVSVTSRRSGATLSEATGPVYEPTRVAIGFGMVADERFAGLGQPPLGDRDRIEVTGEIVRRNYGEDGVPTRGAQGNLLVPLLMSSRGYGVFFNTPLPNSFEAGAFGRLTAAFEHGGDEAELDYYVFAGPDPVAILEQYTRLTGRPLLPPKWAFGLQLSDNEPDQGGLIDAAWWRREVEAMYAASWPIDHIVFDNDWRAGSGGWSGSWFEFSPERYPDPKAFADWYRGLGLTVTLDLNMNIANDSEGWSEAFNLPVLADCPDQHANSYPDYSNPAAAAWVWELFRSKALDPALEFPGEGLWMDETDGVWTECVAPDATIHDGRPWLEAKNEYYTLTARAVTAGWIADRRLAPGPDGAERTERPYVWVRGGSAGGQRYATHWTGDIFHDSAAAEEQLIALQQSGLAGYPYFNHDAGGFVGGPSESAWVDQGGRLTDAVYVDWAMGFGSFTPIWRPHGYASPRWPIRRSETAQTFARLYATTRYELMPYIYSAAIEAAETGLPMALPMIAAFPGDPLAWSMQNQYLWGPSMLVAPSVNMSGRVERQSVWLPGEGDWYEFWTGERHAGGQVIQHQRENGYLPVFVRAGAILPKAPFALNTRTQPKDELSLRIYAGANGAYTLNEDDGESLDYLDGAVRRTVLTLTESADALDFRIGAAEGDYVGAPESRTYTLEIVGLGALPRSIEARVDGRRLRLDRDAASRDAETGLVTIALGRHDVGETLDIRLVK